MVRKYFLQQLGLLLMVSVIMVLTNILGYKMPVGDSIAGILVLCAIALFGLTVSKFMSQFIKLPSMMYVSLTGLLLACPISPVKDFVIGVTSQVAFMAPATALGAFAGISLGKDLKDFAKMGWKLDILIKNCQVLNPDMTVSSTCSVGIKDSWIKKIGPTDELMADSSASEIIDGKGKLVMPGMVDGHTHTCQQLLRGRVADEYPMVWTRFLVPFESNLQPEDSYISGLLACLEMIKSGTTAFADSGGVHMDRVADAVIESGMRAAIAKSTMDMGNAITGAMKETANEAIENTKKLYQKYQGAGDGRVDIWFAIRQVMTCSRELIAMVGESAKEFHTGIHAHLCEHKDEVSFCLQNYKKRPAEFLEEMGILGPNLLTAHNVMLSDHDIALMAERGVKMIHCPRANLSNHGFPKAPQILEAGASLGLGCDGAAPSNLDIFDEMKVLRYAMMAYWGLPSFNPVVMTCPTLLKMASQGGANALGHGDILGSVEEGKKADLILLNIDQPHITPSQNLVNTIVDAANGHDVTDSIINGKIVMKNREVLTLDEERIRFEAEKHMNDIIKRAY